MDQERRPCGARLGGIYSYLLTGTKQTIVPPMAQAILVLWIFVYISHVYFVHYRDRLRLLPSFPGEYHVLRTSFVKLSG